MMQRRFWPLSVILILLAALSAGAENWPRFRGPTGQGISTETKLPTKWDEKTNIKWKVAIPGAGWSSPILLDGRVYLTTCTDKGKACRILCLDQATGDVIWNTHVFDQVPSRKEDKNSYASPTPITDGKSIFAVFGDGSVAAVDLAGKPLWTNREVKHYSRHGLGSSPILFENLLIMPYDGSNRTKTPGQWPNNSEEEKLGWRTPWDQAQIVALDTGSGKRIWTGKRGQSRIAHVTPNIITHEGKPLLVSPAGDVIQGFDPRSGKLLWSAYSQGEGVTPSFVHGNGLIYTSSGFEKPTIRAVKPGGSGDVTATHIAWEQKKGAPTQSSFLFVDPYLYSITDGGIAHCYKADSGDVVYTQRLPGSFCSSPVYADGKIYFLSEGGETFVLKAGPVAEILSKNPLHERCQASLAISGGRIFLRTETTLYCIGE